MERLYTDYMAPKPEDDPLYPQFKYTDPVAISNFAPRADEDRINVPNVSPIPEHGP